MIKGGKYPIDIPIFEGIIPPAFGEKMSNPRIWASPTRIIPCPKPMIIPEIIYVTIYIIKYRIKENIWNYYLRRKLATKQ